jgi:hypothetical protein
MYQPRRLNNKAVWDRFAKQGGTGAQESQRVNGDNSDGAEDGAEGASDSVQQMERIAQELSDQAQQQRRGRQDHGRGRQDHGQSVAVR